MFGTATLRPYHLGANPVIVWQKKHALTKKGNRKPSIHGHFELDICCICSVDFGARLNFEAARRVHIASPTPGAATAFLRIEGKNSQNMVRVKLQLEGNSGKPAIKQRTPQNPTNLYKSKLWPASWLSWSLSSPSTQAPSLPSSGMTARCLASLSHCSLSKRTQCARRPGSGR